MEKFLENRIVMKVEEVAPFVFCFKSESDKIKSYQRLVNFLKSNGWLNERGDKLASLSSYHSDDSGNCHILLSNDTVSEEFIELVNEMFKSLISDNDINWINVGFYPSTQSIIYNNVDKYSRFQSIPIKEMETGDMMVVFKSK